MNITMKNCFEKIKETKLYNVPIKHMPDTLTDIHSWPLSETVFLKEEQKIENNPTYGFFKYKMLCTSTETYMSAKELTKFKESLPRNEFREQVNEYILKKNITEKLFIVDFIQNWYIFPEKSSQDLYFRFNLKTKELAHLDQENGPRLEFLIWWAHYFTLQMEKLKEQGVDMWYIKVSIKKNQADNELYIESIDAVEEKDS